MAGLPTLLVELEDAAGDFTHDITEHVRMAQGWDFRRGRNDEDDTVEPGRLQLTLTNNDSRFTLGSPAYDGITTDKRIRVSEIVDGDTFVRFTGYVQDWPVTWSSPMATTAECGVVAIDRLSRFNRRGLRSVIENEILLDRPTYYATLGEPTGALAAGDTSGNAGPPLAMVGEGTAIVFGNATGPGTDSLTAAEFAGQYLAGAEHVGGTDLTIECFFLVAAPLGGVLPSVLVSSGTSGIRLELTPAGEIDFLGTSSGVVADGETHHAVLVRDSGGTTLYIDGAVADSTALTPAVFGDVRFTVGGTAESTLYAPYTGVIAHAALYDTALSAARVLAHYTAGQDGFETERADQRIERLAAYAGVDPADMDLETGDQPSITQAATSGQKVSAAMADVMEAEGGVLFIAGDGKLTMHRKSHRVVSASSTAALALTTDDIDPDSVQWAADKDYLVNTVSVTREGGAAQTSVNEASVDQFDEYPADRTGLLLPTDGQARDVATWLTATYGDVLPRLASFALDLLTLPEATVKAALALELGDRVTVSGMPTQSPVATADLIVEGLKEDQTKGSWRLTFNTAPASLFHAWILEDATYGVLDSTTKLYF